MRTILLLVLSSFLTAVNTQAQSNISKPVIEKTVTKSYNGSEVSCATANDGEITVIASGGSGKYLYSKDNGSTFQSSAIFTGLINNVTYAIFVKDAESGQVSSGKWVTIKHLNPVTISSALQVISQPQCFASADGIISLTAYGGTGDLKYSIDNGLSFQNSNRFEGLKAGNYRIYITDMNGCNITSNTVTLKGPAELGIEVSTLKNGTCTNPSGSITFRGTGTTGDYNYSIDGKPFFWKAKNEFHTFSDLSAGQHQIAIMDNYNKCLFTYTFIVKTTLTASLSAKKDSLCKDENAELIINIKRDLSFAQVNETYTVVLKDDKGRTFSYSNLSGGEHVFSVGQLVTSAYYKLISVKSTSGCIGYVDSKETTFTILTEGTWLGYTNDWYDFNNWACGIIPSANTNVLIGQTANNPLIDKKGASVGNLRIERGAAIEVKGHLKISGEPWTDANAIHSEEGSIEFNGNDKQWVKGGQFTNRTIKNLIISNTAGVQIGDGSGDTLNITGNLTFGTKTASLYTGNNITLKSTIDGTANIGVVGKGNSIEGKFIVERYINTGTDKSLGQHGKAWMLLSTPTIGSSIFESWQEGAKSTGKTPIENNNKGFGTLFTTGYNRVPSNGFDLYTGPGPSIKTYNPQTNAYDKGPLSTFDPLYNEKGYLVMVRGDRSVYTSNAAANPVILRSKGEIITGTTKEIEVLAGKWESIGNPYASRIYINKIKRTGGVDEFISVWDPKLGGSYGLGAFQTLVNMGSDYMAIPGGGSYGRGPVTFIESGQAFFVQATKEDGSVYFTEDAKTPSLKSIGRGGVTSAVTSSLRTSLFALGSGEAVLADGNLLLTGDYSNEIDGRDARKMENSAENFSILSAGHLLTIESRQQITSEDTLYFNMTGMKAQNYRLELAALELAMPGMQAWLVDAFTGIRTSLNLNNTTAIEFAVNNQPGAAAANRFMIVFRPALVLPVTFTEVKATLQKATILVEWTVEEESNLKQYEVERSIDGKTFSKISTVTADKTNGGKYQWLDKSPVAGYNYYRIRSIDLDGKTSLTQIVKEQTGLSLSSISVYPNPVSNGVVNLQLGNQTEGVYTLRLLNPVGQVLFTSKITHAGGNHTEKINWDHSLPRGMYTLEVSNPQSGVKMIKLMY